MRFPPQQSTRKTLRSESGRTPKVSQRGRKHHCERCHWIPTIYCAHTATNKNMGPPQIPVMEGWNFVLGSWRDDSSKRRSFNPFRRGLSERISQEGMFRKARGVPWGSLSKRSAMGPRRQHHWSINIGQSRKLLICMVFCGNSNESRLQDSYRIVYTSVSILAQADPQVS